ncbi:MAG: hypothetical protein ACETWQ_22550 [Phycisphaerae bacterium]
MKNQYLSLEALAISLGLPKTYLRKLAKQKRIPFLDVSGRKRFQPEDVMDALSKMAKLNEDLQ